MTNILITGASQGIGRATAIEAAKKKSFVGINYSKNSDAAESCLEAVKSHGGDGIILKCDVADNIAVKDMFKKFFINLEPSTVSLIMRVLQDLYLLFKIWIQPI